jgi:hypothetical protein
MAMAGSSEALSRWSTSDLSKRVFDNRSPVAAEYETRSSSPLLAVFVATLIDQEEKLVGVVSMKNAQDSHNTGVFGLIVMAERQVREIYKKFLLGSEYVSQGMGFGTEMLEWW